MIKKSKGFVELIVFIFLIFGLILLIPGVVIIQYYPAIAIYFGLGLLFVGVAVGYALGRWAD